MPKATCGYPIDGLPCIAGPAETYLPSLSQNCATNWFTPLAPWMIPVKPADCGAKLPPTAARSATPRWRPVAGSTTSNTIRPVPWRCSPMAPVASTIPRSQVPGVNVLAVTGVRGGSAASPAQTAGSGCGVGGDEAGPVNSAHTVRSPPATTLQPPGPLQPPPQPVKLDELPACAASERFDPAWTAMLQAPGQSMPAGAELTRPEPVPIRITLTRALAGCWVRRTSKTAVTSRSPLIARSQSAVPEHAPCQPVKADPGSGTAERRTEPLPISWSQRVAQLKAGLDE